MKQLQVVFLTIFSLAFLLTSCGGDDDGIGADAGSGKVTATVDGQNWESKDEPDGAVYIESQGTHIIQAHHSNGSYIALTIFGNITTGTAIPTDNGIFQGQYKPDFTGTEQFSALGMLGSGSITFSTFSSSNVKGTYQFTGVTFDSMGAEKTVEVKNGTFDIDL